MASKALKVVALISLQGMDGETIIDFACIVIFVSLANFFFISMINFRLGFAPRTWLCAVGVGDNSIF
jgi:hypothetical protein